MKHDSRHPNTGTTPPDANLYEYAVIRYVPRVEREEFVNIGLIMMCKRRRWLKCEVRVDEARILALCPGADIALLRRQVALFSRRDVPAADLPVEEIFRWLTAAKSAILQTSQSHPGLSTDLSLDDTFTRLLNDLVL